MTQTELAKRLGISFQQVQKYESGTNRVGAGRLFEIARAFGVPIQEFFPAACQPSDGDCGLMDEAKSLTKFATSVEGRQLCQCYLELESPHKRAVAKFVKELSRKDN